LSSFETYSLRAEDIKVELSDEDRLIPNTFKRGGGMYRFITAPDLSHRAGFTSFTKGQGFSSYFWYDEYWLMVQGRSRVTATDRSTGEKTVVEISARDVVFIGTGTHIEHECISDDEPTLFLYVAVPASKRDGKWLAHMTPEDIQDVRDREEFEWEWPGKAIREP
jgi:mannose-6-phosphate isomerase-like protein (cupin superfamily)